MPMMAEPKAPVDGEEGKDQTVYIWSRNERLPKGTAGPEIKKGRPLRARRCRAKSKRSPRGDVASVAL
jgi:hypothetical protein